MLHRPARERLVGAVGAASVVGLLGAGLIWGLAARRQVWRETPTALIEVEAPPPPPRLRTATPLRTKTAPKAPAPRNLRNTANDVVAPPVVLRAPPPPVVVAQAPRNGTAAESGASDRAGPGEGAGGEGNGSGGGGTGGDGAGYSPPEQLNDLKYGYLAPALRARGAQGTAEVIFHVTERGRVSSCSVRVSSGDRELDAGICQAIQTHLRFRPSRDPSGEPVGANVIASHGWIIDRESEGSQRP